MWERDRARETEMQLSLIGDTTSKEWRPCLLVDRWRCVSITERQKWSLFRLLHHQGARGAYRLTPRTPCSLAHSMTKCECIPNSHTWRRILPAFCRLTSGINHRKSFQLSLQFRGRNTDSHWGCMNSAEPHCWIFVWDHMTLHSKGLLVWWRKRRPVMLSAASTRVIRGCFHFENEKLKPLSWCCCHKLTWLFMLSSVSHS